MLRHVSETSATIWVETTAPCEVEICGRSAPTFRVAGHHYALVVIEGLEPGSTTEYEVHLDGERRWPLPASPFPPSVIRTVDPDGPVRMLFGSCRTAAPHEPPWTLELAHDTRGRGVDALRAHALRMLGQPLGEWPHLLVLLGDQVYADDASPYAAARMEARRADAESEPPEDLVKDFEEYTWLYQESWSPEVERWCFSVVPSTMIFDDHDMIDDWNISRRWVEDIRAEEWWTDHVVGGLMSYWVYQHLGNLSPAEIRAEGILDEIARAGDGTAILRRWALESEKFTPVPGGYRFSYRRDLGRTRLVVVDARNGRVLDPGARRMVDDDEWAWIVEQCRMDGSVDHLVIGTSLPVFVPGGLHDLQVWNEAVCDGAWGARLARVGEKVRRSVDLEDWPAFMASFERVTDLLAAVGSGRHGGPAPSSISVVSGDIHFSYVAEVEFPPDEGVTSHVHQLVSSPIRNALAPRERNVIRFAASRVGWGITRALRRTARGRRSPVHWTLCDQPIFANCLGQVVFEGSDARLTVEQASPADDGGAQLALVLQRDLTEDPADPVSPSRGRAGGARRALARPSRPRA